MKKIIIILFLIFCSNLIISSPVFASSVSIPCHYFPSYVNGFSKYYENVKTNPDPCNLSFYFITPTSYSLFNLKYEVNYYNFVSQLSNSFSDFDNLIRKDIKSRENCANFGDHIGELKLLKFGTLDSNDPMFCDNIYTNLDIWSYEQIFGEFIQTSTSFGNYKTCTRTGNAFSYGGSEGEGNFTISALCDGTKETIKFTTENNLLKKVYFLNSNGEPYREIYPNDTILKERFIMGEYNARMIKYIVISIAIVLILVILFVIRCRAKKFN